MGKSLKLNGIKERRMEGITDSKGKITNRKSHKAQREKNKKERKKSIQRDIKGEVLSIEKWKSGKKISKQGIFFFFNS